MLRFDGQVAIVTGSGAGIGRCYALLFAERGAKVVVNDFSREAADSVVNEINAKGGVAVANYNSVTDGEKVVATAIENFGRVDILVNNAGSARCDFRQDDQGPMEPGARRAPSRKYVRLCLTADARCVANLLRMVVLDKYGRVILITSVNGLYGQFGQTNYSSVKAAMTGFGKSLAKEGARSNIKVNIVAPGAGSKMTESVMPADLVAKWKPEYVAPTIAFLCHESVPCSRQDLRERRRFRRAGQAKFSQITDFSNATDPDDDEVAPQLKQILNAKLSKEEGAMIRLKAKQAEKKAEEKEAAAAVDAGEAPKPKTKILGVGRGKRGGASKEKKRTPGEIRIQKGGGRIEREISSKRELEEWADFLLDCMGCGGYGTVKGAVYDFSFKIPPIYHPNIDLDGNVCLNILREDWKPVLDINSVIYGLIYLFYEPNPDDPLNKAAELFRNDPKQFAAVVNRSLRGYSVQGIEFEQLI
ncbi:Ubiquitin-conjugating enzyme, active site [Phytophthora cactorum]|nr:Ubiquitin-conjugating enzyme, active site [Phytophthora cactorum]